MHTDASEQELGAVLYQDQDNGTTHVIPYVSRNLSKSEKRYHSSRLEFLALKWCICECFHEYLHGRKFEVYTNNNLLTYILTSAKLDATGQRWVAFLANYDFTIRYQIRKYNIEADALSRIKWEHDDATVVEAILARGFNADTAIPFDCGAIQANNINLAGAPKISSDDWEKEQSTDEDIGLVVELIQQGKHLQYTCKEGNPSGMQALLKYKQDMFLWNSLLHRKVKLKHHDSIMNQFVLPKTYRQMATLALHDDYRHLGMEKTLGLLQERFFWPKMIEDVHNSIRTCERCTRYKQPQEREKMKPIHSTYPLDLIHIDFLMIGKEGTDKATNIMVITDHFTQYAQAYITPKQTAPVVAKTLWDQFLVHYGWPTKILTDQGKSLKNNPVKELCSLAQVQKLCTMPYW